MKLCLCEVFGGDNHLVGLNVTKKIYAMCRRHGSLYKQGVERKYVGEKRGVGIGWKTKRDFLEDNEMPLVTVAFFFSSFTLHLLRQCFAPTLALI